MSTMSTHGFQTRCAQLRLLTYSAVGLITVALTLSVAVPIFRGVFAPSDPRIIVDLIWRIPALFYLGAILGIGQAMGRLAQGRPIQATLATAMRRVGLAVGGGGVVSVSVVSNLARWVSDGRGGFLHFDVAGVTLALIGGALFLLGHVVATAARLQAEMDDIL